MPEVTKTKVQLRETLETTLRRQANVEADKKNANAAYNDELADIKKEIAGILIQLKEAQA